MTEWLGRWHHRVHERLGERLYYFLIRLQPFYSETLGHNLGVAVNELQVGSVRVFPLFGFYDLLIRAWLYPSVESPFLEWLNHKLVGARAVHPLTITHIASRWYWQEKDDRAIDFELLETLDEDAIRTAQDGDVDLQNRLRKGNLIIPVDHAKENWIRFFVAIKVGQMSHEVQADLEKKLKDFLNLHRKFQRFSIYVGYGFCDVLVKAQVRDSDYYEIESLADYIGQELKGLVTNTETSLVHKKAPLVGNSKIGESTFRAIEGHNLFVRGILPEAYDPVHPRTLATAVRDFLTKEVHGKSLTRRDRKLLHDLLLGYLKSNAADMTKTLASFFIDIEGYLRGQHKQFGEELTGKHIVEIYAIAGVAKSSHESLTLGDTLKVISASMQLANRQEHRMLIGKWDIVAEWRNKTVHGRIDLLENWDQVTITLLLELPRIRELLSVVGNQTGKPYDGIY